MWPLPLALLGSGAQILWSANLHPCNYTGARPCGAIFRNHPERRTDQVGSPMSTSAVQLFCALLAVAVLVFTVGLAVWRVVASRSPGAAAALDSFRPVAPGLAAAIASGCML